MNDQRAGETKPASAIPTSGRRSDMEDPLGAALRALPPERAGAGFAARVLARLDERGATGRSAPGRLDSLAGHPPRLRPAAAWAALAAAALAVALVLALVRGSAPQGDGRDVIAESAPPAVAAPAMSTGPAAGAPVEQGAAAEPGAPAALDAAAVPAANPGSLPSGGAAADTASPAPARPTSDSDPPIPAGSPSGGRAAGSRDRTPAPAPADAGAVRLASGGRAAAGLPRRAAAPIDDPRSALARVRAELDALRREHRRFEVALAELPEIGRDGQPVVFLGGDEDLGLVLDLGREVPTGGTGRRGQEPGGPAL